MVGIVAALTRLDTYGGPLLAALLLVPTLGLAAAPINSLAAQRAAAAAGARRAPAHRVAARPARGAWPAPPPASPRWPRSALILVHRHPAHRAGAQARAAHPATAGAGAL